MTAVPTDPTVRHRDRRPRFHRTLQLLGGALLLAAASRAQQAAAPAPSGAGRFSGWDALRDPAYTFDPDERPALGFSVRTSPNARADLEDAEAALAVGDLATAARLLQDAVWLHADSVVQVEADGEREAPPPRSSTGTRTVAGVGRWAGVGEVALYELLARVPESARRQLCAPADRRALDEAMAWRDLPRLRELAARLEGLPEGAQAAAAAARLLAERGSRDAARAAADRARLVVQDPQLDALSARLAPPPAPPGVEPGLPRALKPLWSEPLLAATLGRPNNPFATQRDSDDEAPIAPVVPVLQDGIAYVADSISVDAWDVLSGRRLWHHEGPLEAIETQRAWDRFFRYDIYLNTWRSRAVSPWQVAQPALADGRVVAVVQAAEPRREVNDFEGIPINFPLPERRLVCLDAADGRRLWSQERPERSAEDFVNRYSVAGAPVVADGAVYTAGYILEGSLNAYFAAFDLADGELLWRTFICSGQQDLTMFNRPFLEHTPSPPLLHDGALFACSNLGVTASVDAFSGRVRWVTGYEFTARRASRSPDRDLRRDVRWVNRAPQLAGGSLLVMPLDGQQILALDPSTGRTRWTLDVVRSDPRTLRFDALALPDGSVAVADDARIEIVDPATGVSRGGAALPEGQRACGPLALCDGQVLLPTEDGLGVLDPATRQLGVLPWDESLLARQEGRHVALRRRVVAGPRTLLVTDGWDLHAIVDVPALLEAALAHAADGPAARLRAGELLLAGGRLAEAAAQLDVALADAYAPAALRRDLVDARLSVALAVARASGARADWLALLDTAARLSRPFDHAGEALDALDALGAPDDAAAALTRLAARDPRQRLALAARSGEVLPVGLLAALADPPRETPERAVERLQGLIETWPDEAWAGTTVRAYAAGRIAGLLATHGRAPYARWDAQASAALDHASDAAALDLIEARYPNALAVEKLRLLRFEAWLKEGRAGEVLAALSEPPLGGYGRETTALRAIAAEAHGEPVLATALRGEAGEFVPAAQPALPGADARLYGPLELSNLGRLVFPAVAGRFAPEFAHCVLGSIDGGGKLFLLDTAAGRVAWQEHLPRNLTSASAGYLELLAAGDRLLLQVYAPGGNSPEASFDQLYAWSLRDAGLLWKIQLPGTSRGTALADGLLLRLDSREGDDGARTFHLSGYGTGTGCSALQLELPPCEEAHLLLAGGRPVLYTIGGLTRDGAAEDVRLWTVDAAGGRLLGGAALRGSGPRLLLAMDDAPVVLCSVREGVDGATQLLGWDADERREVWRAPSPVAWPTRQSLYPAGEGRVLLEVPASTGDPPAPLRLVPVDAHVGLLPPTAFSEPLRALAGQSPTRAPRLLLGRTDDGARLFVVDARTSERLGELRLPGPAGPGARVVHGRDAWALLQDSGMPGSQVTLRVFDGTTGEERYSGAFERPQKKVEVALAEGALVMASGGELHILRSPAP